MNAPTNYAHRDANVSAGFLITLFKAKHLPLETFQKYWMDIHGPLVSGISGILQYRQLHLAPFLDPSWDQVLDFGFNRASPDLSGVAEMTFLSSADQDLESRLESGVLTNDDSNFLETAGKYTVSSGGRTTHADYEWEEIRRGGVADFTLLTLLTKSPEVSDEHFRSNILQIAEILKADASARLVRTVFPQPGQALPYSHEKLDRHTYTGALELRFPSRLNQRLAFSARKAELNNFLNTAVQTIHTRQVVAEYTFVSRGAQTLLGKYGATNANLILETGALNVALDAVPGRGVVSV